jgi:hypothetical protein
MQQLGILPGQHKYIDLTSYVSWQALLKDQGLLSGQLQLFSNGKVYPLKTNPAYIDTYWLFPVVFVFLFVAFVFIIRLLQQKASGLATIFFPGSLWRSWGDVFKAGWKKTLLLLQRKGQVEPLPPPLEPADLPDLPNAETVAPLYELEETEPDEHGYYRHYKEV